MDESLATLIEGQAALLSTGSDQQDWFRAKEIAEAILSSAWVKRVQAAAWDEGMRYAMPPERVLLFSDNPYRGEEAAKHG